MDCSLVFYKIIDELYVANLKYLNTNINQKFRLCPILHFWVIR